MKLSPKDISIIESMLSDYETMRMKEIALKYGCEPRRFSHFLGVFRRIGVSVPGVVRRNGVILTRRQSQLLRFIAANTHNGVSPTHSEMASGIGIRSTSNIQHLLNDLQEAGFIKLHRYRQRSVEIVRLPVLEVA